MQKLHGLPESVISDKEPQFVVELTKELNRILGIETILSTAFYPQIDGQTKQINQELEQYLRFFIEYKQRDWLEQLAITEFAVNNKVYSVTKVFRNKSITFYYGRELKMGADIRRKSGESNRVCKEDKKSLR